MPQYLSPGVYVEELEAGSRPIEGVGTAVAAFVGLADDGPFHTPTLVTNWTQFTTVFGGPREGAYLAHSVYGYFNNGGGSAYIVRVGRGASGADAADSRASAELAAGGEGALPGFRILALEPGAEGNDIVVEVQHPAGEGETFTLQIHQGEQHETFENLTTGRRQRGNVITVVNQRSRLVRVEEVQPATEGTVARPSPGSVVLGGGAGTVQEVAVRPEEYVGDAADRTGFSGLETVEDVTMVCVPDAIAAYESGAIDLEQLKSVQLAVVAHCELMGDRLAILDPPPGLNAQQVREWRVDIAGYDSKYAAMYWPQIKVFDPLSGQNVFMPPSGHMAGVWARSDATRGVHKAPANEVIRGVVDVEYRLSKNEHDLLNPHGINCIRAFPGRGVRVWGARTLSSDPSWKYINVRRLFNYVEGSILAGTQWVVFEPNDPDLWGRIRRTVSAFLYRVWLEGALFGTSPGEAYYVKCDAETNPSELLEAGQVVCEIGIAAVKPAEFVVFRLAQLPTGTSAVSE